MTGDPLQRSRLAPECSQTHGAFAQRQRTPLARASVRGQFSFAGRPGDPARRLIVAARECAEVSLAGRRFEASRPQPPLIKPASPVQQFPISNERENSISLRGGDPARTRQQSRRGDLQPGLGH